MEEIFVGIDLGTTNTLACYMKKGKPNLIRFGGKTMLPSVLYVDSEKGVMIGGDAKKRGIYDPLNVIRSSKTYMADAGKTWTVGGKTFTPTEVATEILKEVKKQIIKKFKCEPETVVNAVITVPAYFSGNQKDETKKAGAAAGFNVLQIITEPMAAAVAAVRELELNEKIFVVDLGGGTFDISVLQAEQSSHTYRALDVDGDRKLGGDDFDTLIYNYFIDIIQDDLGIELSSVEKSGIAYNEYHSMTGRVLEEAERAKIALSEETIYNVNLPNLFNINGKNYDFKIEMTREDFNDICQPLFDKIVSRIKKFIANSDKFSTDEISTIILAGGSCYIPKVREDVEKIFGKKADSQMELDTLVVYGACFFADSINSGVVSKMQDILSHSLGVEVLSSDKKKMVLSKILNKGEVYPCTFSKIYTTVQNNQTSVPIYVYEAGSDAENIDDIAAHEFYGDVSLENITKAPAGVPKIKVTFSYDASGILSVTAQDEDSHVERKIEIKKSEKPARKKIQASIDFMLLLDTSGSMDGQPIKEAKRACDFLFSEIIDFSAHRLGFMTFDSYVKRLVPLTQDAEKLKNSLRNVNTGGGTNLTPALNAAEEELINSPNKKVIIIVTDGFPFDEDSSLNYARKMKNDGVRIVTIGAGSGIGEDFIKQLSSPNDAYKIDDMSKLQKTFETAILAILESE